MKTLKDKVIVGVALAGSILSLAGMAYFTSTSSGNAATIRVQGSSIQEQMLREAQAQTKSLDRIAKALEAIAKR